ncbi:putative hydro-lyase [Gimesia aquarii]|uniref:Hydro-lyase n=1 Tax=Gimesia aquarii TaxID=2527964 RepID=A0A517W1C9_9PLAN|nr:putative hydro-lyase [Gimesia aquarii]QDT99061.1 hypothetical protein V144x_45710 [Gimesia aquarii]
MNVDRSALQTGTQVRQVCRSGGFTAQTSGLAPGFAQANLVILREQDAIDFREFCERNPKPCPLLEVTEAGDPCPHKLAESSDLRTDLPRYRVWKHGELVEEPTEISHLWQEDLVSFLIGCSFTFESALVKAGLSVRHLDLGVNVPMYRTSINCESAGMFSGPLVVSMRPFKPADAIRAVQITSRFPAVHGAPVHMGFPVQIGIANLNQPDFGDSIPVESDELPLFWACGVTPQAVLMQAKPEFAITHSPGCMFVSDVKEATLAVS